AVKTTAKKVDGGYILNGQKIFITNGARASWVVVFATVDASLGKAGQRAFVVEKGTPGFTSPKLVEKMVLRANETAELVFEYCLLPKENLVGGTELHQPRKSHPHCFRVETQTFDTTRPLVASMAIGSARAAYEYTPYIVTAQYPKRGNYRSSASETLAKLQ